MSCPRQPASYLPANLDGSSFKSPALVAQFVSCSLTNYSSFDIGLNVLLTTTELDVLPFPSLQGLSYLKRYHELPLANPSCFHPVFLPIFTYFCFSIYSKFVFYWDLICSLFSFMKYIYINFSHFLWDCPRWDRFTSIICYWVWNLPCQFLQSPGTEIIWWCKFWTCLSLGVWVFLPPQML